MKIAASLLGLSLSLGLSLTACQQQSAAPAEPAPAAATAPTAPLEAAPAPAPTQAPAETSTATPAADAPCRDQIGEAAATRLAERCRMVSPATHPPCNAANPCALIQNEIDRSCAMWKDGENPPKECEA